MWSASFPRLPSQVIIKGINRSFIKTNKSDANAIYHGATINEILYSKRTIFMKKCAFVREDEGLKKSLFGKFTLKLQLFITTINLFDMLWCVQFRKQDGSL